MVDDRTIYELLDMSGEVAVVTGGPGRVGSQFCDTLAELGAHVVVVSRTFEECQKKACELTSEYNRALPVEADVTDEGDVNDMVNKVIDEFDHVDVVVNNAYCAEVAPFEEMTLEQWHSALNGAMTSTFLCSRAFMKPMEDQNHGSIINIGSIYGIVSPDHDIYGRTGNNSPVNYGPAKAGVIQLTRWLATYFADAGIRVNCISPGGLHNEELAKKNEYYETDFVSNYRERTPLGRMGNDTDLKGVMALLASDAGKWITGQNFVVDGGWTIW